jgi:hypothetical protein
MKKILTRSLYLLIAGLLFSCSSATDSSGSNSDDTNQSGQPMPSVNNVEGLEFGGILSTILFEFETVPNFPPAQFAMGYAWFGNGEKAGDVAINEQPLSAESSSGSTWYTSFSQTSPSSLSNVSFNGSVHRWGVTGDGDVPAFDMQVTSPTSFSLLAPTTGEIDKSKGLAFSWTGGFSGATDSMLVIVVDLSNSKTVVKQGLANNGSYTISADELSDISGEAMIQVVKYRYNIYTTDNKFYQAIAEIVKQVTVTIN